MKNLQREREVSHLERIMHFGSYLIILTFLMIVSVYYFYKFSSTDKWINYADQNSFVVQDVEPESLTQSWTITRHVPASISGIYVDELSCENRTIAFEYWSRTGTAVYQAGEFTNLKITIPQDIIDSIKADGAKDCHWKGIVTIKLPFGIERQIDGFLLSNTFNFK